MKAYCSEDVFCGTMVLTLLYLICLCFQGVSTENPCFNHRMFPTSQLGYRNERCPRRAATVCDYYLPEDWYSIAEGTILTHCPVLGDCGVGYPGWMNGSMPTEAEGIVNRTVCIKGNTGCCDSTMSIKVQRCSGLYVYYLSPFDYCPSGYCFESNQSCIQPTTTPAPSGTAEVDPCISHKEFPSNNFGSRNERCVPPTAPVCDYYLPDGWYSVAEGTLLSRCPNGNCGVGYPAWLNGSLPDISDGIAERSVCVKYGTNCCKETVPARIKKCSNYYVYHFLPLNGCPFGYCFESTQPCVMPTTKYTDESGNGDSRKSIGENDEDSDSLLIGITVTTGLVLAAVSTLLAVVLLQKWFKRNQTTPNEAAKFSGKTVTASVVRIPVYVNDFDAAVCPSKSPPPSYSEFYTKH